MGDYTKLIVTCQVEVEETLLREKVRELGLSSSAYHSQETIEHIGKNDWHMRQGANAFDLILIGQTKYGRGQQEFLKWLEPFVVDASGPTEIWAFQIDEYQADPTLWRKNPEGCFK